ncbi:hypothetical protein B0J12DRAFT_751104 [Macrophomina phaseolina]|uniref:FAD-binding 8 n=1 Tax=Macrophomina phaseolina TaxID=35725 RepID=A0ABQ8GET3_9PEZI|nr:hypothetical protein B0J12DRAFT_751104 [Macrophomina phaseolina]
MGSWANAPIWYAAVLGGLLSLLLTLRFARIIATIMYFRFRPTVLAHLVYSESPPPFRSVSRLAAIFGVIYVAANAVPLAVGTISLEEAGSRAGLVALANVIFLTLGPLSLWQVFLEVLIHAVIAISSEGFHLSRSNSLGVARQTVHGTLTNSGLGGSGDCSFLSLRYTPCTGQAIRARVRIPLTFVEGARRRPLDPHHLSYHHGQGPAHCCDGVPIDHTVWTWLRIAWRNFSWTRGRTTASVRHAGDALQIRITSPRPWKVAAGQRLGDSLEVTLLIQPRDGFTKVLEQLIDSDASAWIDGPYGSGHNLDNFGTVVLFSTGIGIWSHLLYVSELVKGYRQGLVKATSIRLHWRVDRDGSPRHPLMIVAANVTAGQQRDAKLIMDKLLEEDRIERRLAICIYVPDRQQHLPRSRGQAGMTQGRRILTKFEEPVIGAIVEEVLPEDGRKVVISGERSQRARPEMCLSSGRSFNPQAANQGAAGRSSSEETT